MTSRTWTERLKWLYAHQGYWGINRHHRCEGRMYGLWWLYGEEWRYGNPRSGPDAYPSVVDEAMDECDRLEKEAAEKKVKEASFWFGAEHTGHSRCCWNFTEQRWQCEKKDTASRSPVAALLDSRTWAALGYANEMVKIVRVEQLRAAIKAQADEFRRWQKAKDEQAAQCNPRSQWHDGAAHAFGIAADLIEGKG